MSKNFADFNYQKPQPPKDKGSKNNEKQPATNIDEQKIRQAYDNLKDLDSSALASKLAEEVGRQKADSSFDFDLLSQSVEAMRAFLPADTYQNLKKLLENLR